MISHRVFATAAAWQKQGLGRGLPHPRDMAILDHIWRGEPGVSKAEADEWTKRVGRDVPPAML